LSPGERGREKREREGRAEGSRTGARVPEQRSRRDSHTHGCTSLDNFFGNTYLICLFFFSEQDFPEIADMSR
jgi:hypothetical protein